MRKTKSRPRWSFNRWMHRQIDRAEGRRRTVLGIIFTGVSLVATGGLLLAGGLGFALAWLGRHLDPDGETRDGQE